MLPEEQEANSRYFYELASARFGFSMDKLERVQAFHFKGGQGAKTGTGGHLPGEKVQGKIAEVRGLEPGKPAISPSRFPDWDDEDAVPRLRRRGARGDRRHPDRLQALGPAHRGRHRRGAADRRRLRHPRRPRRRHRRGAADLPRQHLGADHAGAGAGAAAPRPPRGSGDVTLIITGGLRTPADFVKALALGADGVAVSNAATPGDRLPRHARLPHQQLPGRHRHPEGAPARAADRSTRRAERLARFFDASVELMKVLARACGHTHLSEFRHEDLTTWKRDMADLTGVALRAASCRL